MRRKIFFLFIIVLCLVEVIGCSHSLEIKNLDNFIVPFSGENSGEKINLGITPFDGSSKNLWYYNEIMRTLSTKRIINKFMTNYTIGRNDVKDAKPDYIISINPNVNYKSSPLNFLISCPGSLIFTHAWNGQVYHANIITNVTIFNGDGKELDKIQINTPYSIRFAQFDRTWWPIFSWNILTPIGGLYSSILYDNDATSEFKDKVRRNYSDYVTDKILQKINAL